MSSSDSEAFESADEDVIETKTSVKKTEKQLNVDQESNKVNIKSTSPEPRKQSPELVDDAKTVIKTNVENQRSTDETSNKLVTHATDSNESETEDIVLKAKKGCIDVTQIEKKSSKLSLNSSCEFIEMDSVTKSADSEAKVEDDWDFDKWEDDIEDEVEELVSKSKSTVLKDFAGMTQVDSKDEKKLSTKVEEEHAEKLSDEDGWQIDDWDDDNTPNENSEPNKDVKTSTQGGISNVLDKLSSPKPAEPTNWGWTPWGGMVQLISTATSHVSQAIESGIGVPNPEEIARLQHEESLKNREQGAVPDIRKDDKSMLLGNLMSGVSQIGNRVISGGLDTLEGIGKRTMTMLQENDPGLLNKRKMLGMMDKDTPVLSQILREAKEKTEEAEQNLKEMQKQRYKKQLHFESLFDDYHGLVHLEALEMLSQQSALKLKALMSQLTGLALSELEETLNEVKELCELPEMDNEDSDGLHTTEELSDKFNTSVEDLDITVDFKDIIQ